MVALIGGLGSAVPNKSFMPAMTYGIPAASRARVIGSPLGPEEIRAYQQLAFSAFSTLGGRLSPLIPICTAWCPGEVLPWMDSVGSPRPGFFLPVKVLSRRFRKLYLRYLERAYAAGKLRFHGDLEQLSDAKEFARYLAALAEIEWVVYAKPPFGGPERVLDYLGRYTPLHPHSSALLRLCRHCLPSKPHRLRLSAAA
jgi:hypothetical protein